MMRWLPCSESPGLSKGLREQGVEFIALLGIHQFGEVAHLVEQQPRGPLLRHQQADDLLEEHGPMLCGPIAGSNSIPHAADAREGEGHAPGYRAML